MKLQVLLKKKTLKRVHRVGAYVWFCQPAAQYPVYRLLFDVIFRDFNISLVQKPPRSWIGENHIFILRRNRIEGNVDTMYLWYEA